MEKKWIDGESLEGQALINAVIVECSVKGCTGTHLCQRCNLLSDTINKREEIPVDWLITDVKDVELVKSLL